MSDAPRTDEIAGAAIGTPLLTLSRTLEREIASLTADRDAAIRERDKANGTKERMLLRVLFAEGSEDCPFCNCSNSTPPQCPLCELEATRDTLLSDLAAAQLREKEAVAMCAEFLTDLDWCWSFDNSQQHTHSWHDKQDFMERARKALASITP